MLLARRIGDRPAVPAPAIRERRTRHLRVHLSSEHGLVARRFKPRPIRTHRHLRRDHLIVRMQGHVFTHPGLEEPLRAIRLGVASDRVTRQGGSLIEIGPVQLVAIAHRELLDQPREAVPALQRDLPLMRRLHLNRARRARGAVRARIRCRDDHRVRALVNHHQHALGAAVNRLAVPAPRVGESCARHPVQTRRSTQHQPLAGAIQARVRREERHRGRVQFPLGRQCQIPGHRLAEVPRGAVRHCVTGKRVSVPDSGQPIQGGLVHRRIIRHMHGPHPRGSQAVLDSHQTLCRGVDMQIAAHFLGGDRQRAGAPIEGVILRIQWRAANRHLHRCRIHLAAVMRGQLRFILRVRQHARGGIAAAHLTQIGTHGDHLGDRRNLPGQAGIELVELDVIASDDIRLHVVMPAIWRQGNPFAEVGVFPPDAGPAVLSTRQLGEIHGVFIRPIRIRSRNLAILAPELCARIRAGHPIPILAGFLLKRDGRAVLLRGVGIDASSAADPTDALPQPMINGVMLPFRFDGHQIA